MKDYDEVYKLYEEFKMQWIKDHISFNELMHIVDCYKEDDEGFNSFEDWLEEYGFEQQLYPCFDEWFNNEYQDEEISYGEFITPFEKIPDEGEEIK